MNKNYWNSILSLKSNDTDSSFVNETIGQISLESLNDTNLDFYSFGLEIFYEEEIYDPEGVTYSNSVHTDIRNFRISSEKIYISPPLEEPTKIQRSLTEIGDDQRIDDLFTILV